MRELMNCLIGGKFGCVKLSHVLNNQFRKLGLIDIVSVDVVQDS